jgi:hypothetical protein
MIGYFIDFLVMTKELAKALFFIAVSPFGLLSGGLYFFF